MTTSRISSRPTSTNPIQLRIWHLVVIAIVLAAASFALGVGLAQASGGISTGSDGSRSDNRGDSKYQRLWDKVSARDKRWARKTAECESGRDPKAVGGGGQYRGAFMFLKSSWRTSPKSPGGDPIDYPYSTQAVVAVALKHRDGTKPWPVCG